VQMGARARSGNRANIAIQNGATFLGAADRIGSVRAGKADLVLLNGDLAKDVPTIEKPDLVFKAGVGVMTPKQSTTACAAEPASNRYPRGVRSGSVHS
jgi:hypothetical protein